MKNPLETAVLKTLAYSDIFSFPLSSREVHLYLISEHTATVEAVSRTLKNLTRAGTTEVLEELYCFKDQTETIGQRLSEMRAAAEKKTIIDQNLHLFTSVPGVDLVGLTGKLALGVADTHDDIDILIIANSGLIWTVRFMTTIKADLKKIRRKPSDTSVKDRFCLNMFLDRSALAIPEAERDIFTAHELVQMKPLYSADNVYGEFLSQNRWVAEFMANAYEHRIHASRRQSVSEHDVSVPGIGFLRLMEPVVRSLQRWYMADRVTHEVIEPRRIRFHPHDARDRVLEAYEERLASLDINA